MEAKPALVFVWENFGPMHKDRCDAVAAHFGDARRVVGIELFEASATYSWEASQTLDFKKVTLFQGTLRQKVSGIRRTGSLLRACLAQGRGAFFFCHYEFSEVFWTAIILRLLGRNVYVMNDSKFDDKPRLVLRELFKSVGYLPYQGALVSAERSKQYLRFLRFRSENIETGYDTLSVARIRRYAAVSSDQPVSFASRPFVVVARLVEKKNLPTLLNAYALYVKEVASPRGLELCGDGPLESQLRQQAATLGIGDLVRFHGFLQSPEVSRVLAGAIALLLPSTEEQFGLVVIEAQALGLPILYTPPCGARDELLRSGVNGFMVEPDNVPGMAYYLQLLSSSEELWRRLSAAALESSSAGDVARFAQAIERLTH
jgi:glycosyltransferase involved in cell wall biosynthesis